MSRSVYVVRAEPGPVKIGIATKPRKRLGFLQVAAFVPLSLEFIGECSADNAAAQIEARAHELLKEKHQHGEWFAVTVQEAVAAVIQAAQELGHFLNPVDVPGRRPKQTGTAISVRCSGDFLATIDEWRTQQTPIPSRPEALRQLAEIGLKRSSK